VLPPVSQHFSSSSADFRERLVKLSEEELDYLVSLIFEGMESLHCVKKSMSTPSWKSWAQDSPESKLQNFLNSINSQVIEMPHVMELFGKTRVVVKDGKVVEVGEPMAEWCPVFSKTAGVSKLTAQEAKRTWSTGYGNLACSLRKKI